MDRNNTAQLIEGLMSGRGRDKDGPETPLTSVQAEGRARLLRELAPQIMTRHTFRPGQLVTLKVNMGRDYKRPVVNEPALVCEVLENPLPLNLDDEGTPFAADREDIILAIILESGEVARCRFDSIRFEPYTGPGSDKSMN